MVKFQENLANRGILRVQMNCLSAMYPLISLDDNTVLYPRGAVDLGNGYALLRVRDDTASYTMSPPEVQALQTLWIKERWPETNFHNNMLQ